MPNDTKNYRYTTVLDGGMGRQLKALGAPFRQPEWSALALMEGPHFVRTAHDQYVEAGADVITTNSYAVVPFHIGEERFEKDGYRLAKLAGDIARASADASARPVRVAGSLPPPCGSYQPDSYDPIAAKRILSVLVEAMRPSVDLWLAETLNSTAEAYAAAQAIGFESPRRQLWLSFSLVKKRGEDGVERVTLHSGESIAAAVDAALDTGAESLLFNCAAPELMQTAVAEARAAEAAARAASAAAASASAAPVATGEAVPVISARALSDSDSESETAASVSSDGAPESAAKKLRRGAASPAGGSPRASLDGVPPLRFGVYANLFMASKGAANAVLNDLRFEVTPELYAEFAEEWRAAGASIIGGCCGIGPDHIRVLGEHLNGGLEAAS